MERIDRYLFIATIILVVWIMGYLGWHVWKAWPIV